MKLVPTIRMFLVMAMMCLVVSGAWAQRTTFNPSINIGASYTDNIEYSPDDEGGEISDTATRIELDLPVSREWEAGSLEFYYRPSYVKQTDVDRFDRDEHRLGFSTTSVIDRRTSWGFSTAFSRTENQFSPGVPESGVEDGDNVLTDRTTRDSYGASLSLARTQSPRWNWEASLDWNLLEHDREDIPSTVVIASSVEDRTDYGGTFGFSRSLGRGSTLGLQYRHQRFDLDESGEEDSDSLSVIWNRTVSRSLELGLSVGGFKSTGEASDGTNKATDDDERTGAQGSFNVTRRFRNSRLAFSASHQPSSGGHLRGTSTNTDAGLTYSGTLRQWDWNLSGRYGVRDPADSLRDDLTIVSAGFSIERFFQRNLGVRFGSAVTDQSSDISNDDRSAFSLDLGFVWYPAGRTRLGGGSSS